MPELIDYEQFSKKINSQYSGPPEHFCRKLHHSEWDSIVQTHINSYRDKSRKIGGGEFSYCPSLFETIQPLDLYDILMAQRVNPDLIVFFFLHSSKEQREILLKKLLFYPCTIQMTTEPSHAQGFYSFCQYMINHAKQEHVRAFLSRMDDRVLMNLLGQHSELFTYLVVSPLLEQPLISNKKRESMREIAEESATTSISADQFRTLDIKAKQEKMYAILTYAPTTLFKRISRAIEQTGDSIYASIGCSNK